MGVGDDSRDRGVLVRRQAPGWQRLATILRVGPLEYSQIKARLGSAAGGALAQAQQKGLIEKGPEGWQLVRPAKAAQQKAQAGEWGRHFYQFFCDVADVCRVPGSPEAFTVLAAVKALRDERDAMERRAKAAEDDLRIMEQHCADHHVQTPKP